MMTIYIHSVAGATCLVDFYHGPYDNFTILMDLVAANDLQKSFNVCTPPYRW